MKRLLGVITVVALVSGSGVRADEGDTKAVIDQAIKALGGEEKLAKPASSKVKGTITIDGNANPFTVQTTVASLERYRGDFEGSFGGNDVKVITVLNGDKGWRKVGDKVMDLDGDMITTTRRHVYIQQASVTVVPLKGKGFTVEPAGEEKVGETPAVVLKVTGPDGKDFRIFFDKATHLPLKSSGLVIGFGGEEYTQETTYSDYKEFDGVKRPTKVASTRDGQPFIEHQVLEYKLLDSVDPDTYAEPK
jgi:hypothetical protein